MLLKGLFRGGLFDIVRCDEKSYLLWKWQLPSTNRKKKSEIRWGSKLKVKAEEAAVIVLSSSSGIQKEMITGPTDMVLKTENIPIISNILNIAYNGESPFTAEAFFVNLSQSNQAGFAVPYFAINDGVKGGNYSVAVRGFIRFGITNPDRFIEHYGLRTISIEDFKREVQPNIVEIAKSALRSATEEFGISLYQLEEQSERIKNKIGELLWNQFNKVYGVALLDININAIDIIQE